jgi:hypothetical protein
MRYLKNLLIAVLLLVGVFSLILSDEVDGSGSQAATFDRIELEVTPTVQGMGGEFEVTVTCYFYGGCCYPLFSNDIIPDLEIPPGLTLISGPSPEKKDHLTAAAGGDPTIIVFKWKVHCTEKGSYFLNASVETSDCGSREESQEIHVIKGATISNPETFPEDPTSDKDTMISFISMYPVGNIEVTDARIYYLYSNRELDPAELTGENQSLIMNDEIIGEGDVVQCSSDQLIEGGFRGTIPKGSRSNLYYWIQVTDERGELTTSSVRYSQVEDTAKVDTLNMISFLFLAIGMVIVISGLAIGYKVYEKRSSSPDKDDNFTVLGSIGRKRFLTIGEAGNIDVKKESNISYIIVVALIVLALIAAIIGLINGQAAELFDHFLEGI